MVEDIAAMPGDTLGFRLSGKVDRDEYFRILDPVKAKLERGEKVSFLIETAPDFEGLDMASLWEDAKAAPSLGLRYRESWERMAVVTDKDWMRHAISAVGWLMPGEIRIFEPHELDQAKAWTGGAS
jgi:hypothetical protein